MCGVNCTWFPHKSKPQRPGLFCGALSGQLNGFSSARTRSDSSVFSELLRCSLAPSAAVLLGDRTNPSLVAMESEAQLWWVGQRALLFLCLCGSLLIKKIGFQILTKTWKHSPPQTLNGVRSGWWQNAKARVGGTERVPRGKNWHLFMVWSKVWVFDSVGLVEKLMEDGKKNSD